MLDSNIQLAENATLSAVAADLRAHLPTSYQKHRSLLARCFMVTIVALASSGFHAMFLYRAAAFAHRWKLFPIQVILEKLIYHMYHCVLPGAARFGPGINLPHPLGIVVNRYARVGSQVCIMQGVQLLASPAKPSPLLIGDRVLLSANSIIVKTVVHEESIVGAGAVVTTPVPARHVATGVPARCSPMRPELICELPLFCKCAPLRPTPEPQ